ncbi:MAG: hypothetical protein AAF928_00680 [Myxococcota bacterium]
MSGRLVLLTLSFIWCSGCAYGGRDLYLPPTIPAFSEVDVEASEVVLRDVGEDLSIHRATELRTLVAETLEEANLERADAGSTKGAARFRMVVTIDRGDRMPDPMWLLMAVPALLGATVDHVEADVTFTLQSADGKVEVAASAKDGGGAYASAAERAIVLAIQKAMGTQRTAAPLTVVGRR